MKSCPPLRREANFEVKMHKTPERWSTFGSWDFEKVRVVVARNTFGCQNVQNTPTPEHFWKLSSRKSARRCGAKHISKSKCTKHFSVGALLEVELSKKCTPLWRSTCQSQNVQNTTLGPLFDVQMSFRVAGARDCAPCQKWEMWGFCGNFKSVGRRGYLKRICRCILHGRRNTRDTWIRYVRRSGRWFPERLLLEHQSSGLLRWFCGTGAALLMAWPSLFRGRRSTLRQVEWKNRKTHWYEAVSSALNFPFFKEISQNCCVLDVVNFGNWGNLAELLRFGWCQVPKLRKSCRIAAFLMLSSTKNQEVSQNSFVLKLSDRQINR